MDFRQSISELCRQGFSISEIAAEIGVTPNAVREVVAGRTKAPRALAAMKLVALCKKVGVSSTPASRHRPTLRKPRVKAGKGAAGSRPDGLGVCHD